MSVRAVLLGAIGAFAVDCATATALVVDVYTEVACDKAPYVAVIGAPTLADLPSHAVTGTSRHCEPAPDGEQHMGSVVIVPARGNDSTIAFAVMIDADNGKSNDCL